MNVDLSFILDWNSTITEVTQQKDDIDTLMNSSTSSSTNATLTALQALLQQLEDSLQEYLGLLQSRTSITGFIRKMHILILTLIYP